jgi:hypothetical protein
MGECGTRSTADPRVWGPEAWQMLHVMAQNFPSTPSVQAVQVGVCVCVCVSVCMRHFAIFSYQYRLGHRHWMLTHTHTNIHTHLHTGMHKLRRGLALHGA